jgi:hypothetical protein
MQALKKPLIHTLAWFLVSSVFFTHFAIAETDLTAQENFLKARAMNHQKDTDHSAHFNHVDKNQEFHGVFYGFVPCDDCPGVKNTLSLKQNNNYLLVIQYARESSRELYEKGKYTWDDDTHMVVLTPRKDAAVRRYRIENAETLIQLNQDGTRISGSEADRYTLRRSDTVKSREVHFH